MAKDRHIWTPRTMDSALSATREGFFIRTYNGKWTRANADVEAGAEMLRLSRLVDALTDEVEAELRGQAEISAAAGGMHDKLSTENAELRSLCSRCLLVLKWADEEASPSASRRNLIADLRSKLGRD